MRVRTTSILLVVTALALAYFFLIEQPRHKRDVEQAARAAKLTALEPGNISALSIARPGMILEFDRRDAAWRMLEPASDKADQRTLNTLVQEFTDAKIATRFSAGKTDFAQYGLESPAAVVSLTTPSEASALVIEIGDFNLTKDRCYARIKDTPDVILLSAAIRHYSLLSVFEYRNKRVLELAVDDISRLRILSNGRSLDWSCDDGGVWHAVLGGDTIRGDATRIGNVIRELRGIRARDIPFPVTDPDGYFSDVAGVIDLWTRADASRITVTFSVGEDGDGTCYVRTSQHDRISLIESAVLDIFEKTTGDLRDRRLLEFERAAAARITLQTPDIEVSIIRSGVDWTFTNPEFGSITLRASDTLLARLENLEFAKALEEKLFDDDGYGFANPACRLTILDSGGGVIDALSAGERLAGDDGYYVTSRSGGLLAVIESTALAGLITNFENLGQ